MTAPHVSIIGSALSGNKGAAAMLESSVEAILAEFPDASFTLFSMYPAEDRRQNPFPQLEIIDARPRPLGTTINLLALLYRILPPLRGLLRRTSRSIGALARSSVLLDQMGISFTDGREKFLLYNTAAILPAFHLKIPVVKCAQAIGPFTNPVTKRVSRWFLPRVHMIITRGRITHEYATAFGLTNLLAGADSAFRLALSGDEDSALAARLDLSVFDSGATVVGVSPSVVVQKKFEATGGDYLGLMAGLIDELTASGTRVVLIPHSVRTGTDKEQNNDLPMCRRLFAQLERPDGVLFVDEEFSSQELRRLIGRCDLFVTSRFHAMVSALSVATPVLVMGWSHKYEEVLEMFGLAEWAMPYAAATGEGLRARVSELENAAPQIVRSIQESLPGVLEAAALQEQLISGLIKPEAAHR